MDVGSSGGARHGMPESDEGNAPLPQKRQQRSSFVTIRVERDIHGIAMIESQAIMGRRLPKSADRQCVAKGLREESLNFRRIR